MISPNLVQQKYLFVLASIKMEINISKIRKNLHKLHSETRIKQFLKRHGSKEFVTFVTQRGLQKITFSYHVLHTPTLYLNLKIVFMVLIFLTY